MILFRLLLILFLSCSVVNAETPDKWEGYIEFTGKPGTTRSLGVSDLLVPLWQDKNDMSFLNVRGVVTFDNDQSEVNIGLGHRHIFDEFILGGYAFYDKSESDLGFNYDQWTLGLEMLGEKWDVRANGYIADQDKNEWETVVDHDEVVIQEEDIWVDYDRTTHFYKEKSLSGLDGEIGYKLPILEDTRIYAGGYHFFGEDGFESVSGPRVRLETRLYDLPYLGNGSRIMLGLESQYDDPRGSQTSGLLSLRIPFGIKSKNQKSKLKGLDRRMIEPVVRDIDIVTVENNYIEKKTGQSQAFNPEGLAYTRVLHVDSADSMDEINEAANELIVGGELPLVLIREDGEAHTLKMGEDTINGGATFALAGKFLKVDYDNKFSGVRETVAFTPDGEMPELKFLSDEEWVIDLDDRSHINGFDIDATGYKHGAWITKDGNYYISNSSFSNADIKDNSNKGNGLTIQSGNDTKYINVYVEDSSFFGNINHGIHLILPDGYTGAHPYLEISSSELYNNTNYGLHAFGASMKADNIWSHHNNSGIKFKQGSMFELSNSVVSNNSALGVYVHTSNAKIDNVLFEYNGENEAYNSGLKVEAWGLDVETIVTNSIFRYNMRGIDHHRGGKLTIENSLIEKNLGIGIHVYSSRGLHEDSTEGFTIDLVLKDSFIVNNGDTGLAAATYPIEGIIGNKVNLEIDNVTLANNGEFGLSLSGTVFGSIKNSKIYGNKDAGIYAQALNGAVETTATKNYIQSQGDFYVENVDVYGNGGYGIWNAGNRLTVTDSNVHDNKEGSYFSQTGVGIISTSSNPHCIRADGVFTVDGVELDIPETELEPIPGGAACTAEPASP